jgi:hypothetical protein
MSSSEIRGEIRETLRAALPDIATLIRATVGEI